MEIIDYIPLGKDNAVTRRELVARTGMTDRIVREAIATARCAVPIISSGKGYYQPTTWREVEGWIRQETARARSIFRSMRGAREYLKKYADEALKKEISNG